MISKRIEKIASFIELNDEVLDVGCDHGYLSIYLKENNLCKSIYASDISSNALEVAKNNILKKELHIKTYLSDGFKNIPVKFNTAVITGMGTNTILKILSYKKPEKLVLGSQNELYKLRSKLYKMGYSLIKEEVVLENNHYYNILLYRLGNEKLKNKYLKFGISNNNDYFQYLINKNKEIIKKVPILKKIKLYYDNFILKGLIKRK